MDSSDVLLRKEGDGRGYYQRCGAEAGIPELSRLFDMMTQDEVRHADALRALRNEARVDLPKSNTLEGALPILRRLSIETLGAFSGDLATYRKVMDYEATNVRICGELARQASHRWERELFQKIAADEEIHFTILEQVRELLQPVVAEWRGDAN